MSDRRAPRGTTVETRRTIAPISIHHCDLSHLFAHQLQPPARRTITQTNVAPWPLGCGSLARLTLVAIWRARSMGRVSSRPIQLIVARTSCGPLLSAESTLQPTPLTARRLVASERRSSREGKLALGILRMHCLGEHRKMQEICDAPERWCVGISSSVDRLRKQRGEVRHFGSHQG